jgi:KDO2-lipid IV(A) lauroyltransferase
MFLEAVRNVTYSKEQLRKRLKVLNPEVIEQFYDRGQSVLLVGAHYGNWEYMVTGQNLLFRHQAVGIGARISNGFWNKKLNARRERFGMRVITKRNLHQRLNDWQDETLAILVLFDQSPVHTSRAYWTNFQSQPTGFLFGAEKLSYMYDMPVVYCKMNEIERGHYQLKLEVITEQPREEAYGAITEALIPRLEEQVRKAPEYWLWSHKRWKRTPPEDFNALRRSQRAKYSAWKMLFA